MVIEIFELVKLVMKLLTCKIECEKVKKIIDNITCPYMNLWR